MVSAAAWLPVCARSSEAETLASLGKAFVLPPGAPVNSSRVAVSKRAGSRAGIGAEVELGAAAG